MVESQNRPKDFQSKDMPSVAESCTSFEKQFLVCYQDLVGRDGALGYGAPSEHTFRIVYHELGSIYLP